jgi:biotin carboxylase
MTSKRPGTLIFVSMVPGDVLRAAQQLYERIAIVFEVELPSQLTRTIEQITASPFDETELVRILSDYASRNQVAGVVTFDERAVIATASVQKALGLPGNARDAAYAARNKFAMRSRFRDAGVATPEFALVRTTEDAAELTRTGLSFPCVLKPLFGLASEGVLRIDDISQLEQRFPIVRQVADRHRGFHPDDPAHDFLLLETYLPGQEVAVDGFLADGKFLLAGISDKPDPLEGPTFEETIYVSPTSLPARAATAVVSEVARGVAALGLRLGPIHAELRLTPNGPVLLEIGARAIGGVCGRLHSYGLGLDYLGIALRSSLGEQIVLPQTHQTPSGVMMIPVPQRGRLEAIDGIEQARQIEGIRDVIIISRPGDILVGLPETGFYVGFILAVGESQANVVERLNECHRTLKFTITPM